MKTVTYKNDGLVFSIDIAEESGCVFNSAKSDAIGYLNRIDSKGFLQDFHDHIEKGGFDYDGAPCAVTIKNGGYSD